MSIFEYGRAKRFPLAPPVSKIEAALAASPAQKVATSGFTSCMVSYMARPAVTLPPGLLIYISMSLSASSFSRNRSCAMARFARLSSIGPPTKMIRSFSRREKMSKARSPRAVCSTTIGTKCPIVLPYLGGRHSGNRCFTDLCVLHEKIQCFSASHRIDDHAKAGGAAQSLDDGFAALPVGTGHRIELPFNIGGRDLELFRFGHFFE